MTASWVANLSERVLEYVHTLAVPDRPGRFLPCVRGVTAEGGRAGLGFSCFALKIYYTVGEWNRLAPTSQRAWIDYLRSFQTHEKGGGCRLAQNAFVDQTIVQYLSAQTAWYRQLGARVLFPRFMTATDRAIIAETKQAVTSLAQVGESPVRAYRPFPTTPRGIRNYLCRLDWTKPWAAGGQASALAVLIEAQGDADISQSNQGNLLRACASFFQALADSRTGAYFRGPVPHHGELVNGAMKVLTALDWLGVPIHYPENLIDTCLDRLPNSEGCHVVDAIYVLYRCAQQTVHKRLQIHEFCGEVLKMIERHHNEDGGFSYDVRRSQTSYYGVPISTGLEESDIHGTCLLTWAVAMIQGLTDDSHLSLKVIRP